MLTFSTKEIVRILLRNSNETGSVLVSSRVAAVSKHRGMIAFDDGKSIQVVRFSYQQV